MYGGTWAGGLSEIVAVGARPKRTIRGYQSKQKDPVQFSVRVCVTVQGLFYSTGRVLVTPARRVSYFGSYNC
jgi:hypothetical protein